MGIWSYLLGGFSLGLQPYPLIDLSEIDDHIKSGKVLDKQQLCSDEM